MKYILFVCCISFMLTTSCTKEQPGALPAAIDQLIDSSAGNCTCDPYISKYSWRGSTVYLQGFTGPTCNWMPTYYDAQGKPVAMAPGYSLTDFLGEATLIKLIWSCKTGRS